MLNKVKRSKCERFTDYFYEMRGAKKINLKRIKVLMLISEVLLLLFTAQWLYSQYNDQQEQLKKNLTKLFTDVQQKITDSLLLTHVIDPAAVNKHLAATMEALPADNSNAGSKKVKLSPQGLHRLLTGPAPYPALRRRNCSGWILLYSMKCSPVR